MTFPKETTLQSGIRDNHFRGKLGDYLKSHIKPECQLSVVSAYFTIYAYQALALRHKPCQTSANCAVPNAVNFKQSCARGGDLLTGQSSAMPLRSSLAPPPPPVGDRPSGPLRTEQKTIVVANSSGISMFFKTKNWTESGS